MDRPVEQTLSWDIVIVERTAIDGVQRVTYERLSTGEQWEVIGACNQCGLCVIGAAFPEHYEWSGPPGTPYAVRDKRVPGRLDEVVSPGFIEAMQKMRAVTPTATQDCQLTLNVLAPEDHR